MPVPVYLCLGVSASGMRVFAAARVHEGGCARGRLGGERRWRGWPWGCARDLLSAGLADGNLAPELIACLSLAGRSPRPPTPHPRGPVAPPPGWPQESPLSEAAGGFVSWLWVSPKPAVGLGWRCRLLPVTRAPPAGHRASAALRLKSRLAPAVQGLGEAEAVQRLAGGS